MSACAHRRVTIDVDRQDVKPPEIPTSVSALLDRLAPEPAIAPPLTPRQADLLARLLDVQSVSFEARQLLDEPRWADTGEPVEDDAPLLREALRLEAEGKNRSSYIADFERKLALLNDGRRLPKRGREAAVVEREPVNDEPLAGGEDAARALLNRENEDGISLLEYQNQIDDIADYLDAIDPHNDERDEDHTTAQQVIAILRRVVGQGDLSAALKPHPPCDGLAVEIVELGGVEPHVMLGARISRETAQRLGRSPGLYGKVTVLLPGEGR
jgi:hypothetical protein